MTAWLDLDIILYQGLFATKNEPYLRQIVCCSRITKSILERVKPDDFVVVCSGSENFRKKLYPEYKANRTAPKPKYLQDAKQWFKKSKRYNAIITDGIEADDYIAMNYLEGDILCSIDKDFSQIAGATIYNHKKDITTRISEYDAWKNFCIQMLIGDQSDNVPGIKNPDKSHYENPPNFTEATARKLLEGLTIPEMKEQVEALYQWDNNTELFALHGRLLWLLRSEDDDFTKNW